MNLKPLNDSVLFTFVDKANSRGFENITETGIIYKSYDDSAGSPRWARVVEVGPKVTEIEPGMVVLIEALRWTEGFEFQGTKYWITVEDEIMAIKEDE